MVGDVIRWEWTSGVHTTTSASVPQGAASWDADLTQAFPLYEYTVEVQGTYAYFCSLHVSSGMAGAFIASVPASITPSLNNTPREMMVGLEMDSKTLHITLKGGETTNGAIKIYDLTEKVIATIYEGSLGLEEKRITYDAALLGRGIYFVRLEEENKVITRKIMIN